ncbi:MAG: FAD-dependent oxidoreductase [Bacteroidetes bacterium]|nr:FAD-dependent oxidoreductase [Bacteroidota bacterium]MDA1336865.1 FAD-dependent oxidoreductase [Bacteroidota bacterium]
MSHPKYPHLFEPIKFGSMTLPNRVIMGSMHTGLEEERGGIEKLARFYEERAKGGVGLIVTGGISPNREGALGPGGARMQSFRQAKKHRIVTDSVHEANAKIFMQILHGGRYSYHPWNVAPSAIKAPINRFKPRALNSWGIRRTIKSFVRSAVLAKEAGYDGVEIMGSEGYLINQFIVSSTNKRTDEYGGAFKNRIRFPIEIIEGIRETLGNDFGIMYRLSMLDLVDSGSSWDEVVELAQRVELAGADAINTGIGWHEARIPTIATLVPRGGFTFVTKKLMGSVKIPLITSNRLNTPEACESAIAEGHADMVSMARPFLADPVFINKAAQEKSHFINTCIGCNQACLDHIFQRKVASCLVNPRASHEDTWPLKARTKTPKSIAVVGAGPAGLSASTELARLGNNVSLFEQNEKIGGQFNLAKSIPGKEEFNETLRYFTHLLEALEIDVRLNTRATLEDLNSFDLVVVASGVQPRKWNIQGVKDSSRVHSYTEVLSGPLNLGKNVAIIGAGGIGFDVAEFLLHEESSDNFFDEWGIDRDIADRGGLKSPTLVKPIRNITMFQRSEEKVGGRLGKTTGWIHRNGLKRRGVVMKNGISYSKLEGNVLYFEERGQAKSAEFDDIVVCIGQEAFHPLKEELEQAGKKVYTIGGAHNASGLDAERAILEGLQLAYSLDEWRA